MMLGAGGGEETIVEALASNTNGNQSTGSRRWRGGVAGLRRGLTYVRQLSASPEVDLVAVADPDEEKRDRTRQDYQVPHGYNSLSEMLDDDLDFVVIATPLPLHAQHAIEALDRGVHVLSEVTACATLDEAQALVAAVERSGKTYMMGENCCYWGVVHEAKQMRERGEFGAIFYAEAENAKVERRSWNGSLSA